ncbi:MAG: tRNA (adenosine(37)-N6)-dimethylallyltransferase MiaA [Elusimicrobiaceae bacterium]|nr:tRNA (adenosine(37)-N6)-dimethylallyltransferase MiaA [Elusimicrobiaceae bacterium]
MKHIVIAGPTASGKTELSLVLARKLNTEIISADSRQVFRKLTVGTAKPQGHWQNGKYWVNGVAYHLVDFLEPAASFDVSSFCNRSQKLTDGTPDKPFIFAGGTGMYIHAHFVGLDPLPPSSPALRAELTAFAEKNGKEALHERLAHLDPVSAAQIPAGNIQRVMRALEICLLSGQAASGLKSGNFFGQFPSEKALLVYLNWDKDILNKRIEKRTQEMLNPMAEETRALLASGAEEDCNGLKSLGYPQILQWLKGEKSKEETLEKIITLTRQYAKRQRTWFNRYKNALRVDLCTAQDFDVEKITDKILEEYN